MNGPILFWVDKAPQEAENSPKSYQTMSGTTRGKLRFMVNRKSYLTAKEMAAALGISKQTLIRYEQKGIFPKAHRNQVNRWREYTSKDLQVLQKIMGRS